MAAALAIVRPLSTNFALQVTQLVKLYSSADNGLGHIDISAVSNQSH